MKPVVIELMGALLVVDMEEMMEGEFIVTGVHVADSNGAPVGENLLKMFIGLTVPGGTPLMDVICGTVKQHMGAIN